MQILLNEVLEKGLKKGWHKGRQEGLQEGMQQGRKEIALKLLFTGLDLETVSKCTGLSEENLKNIQKAKKYYYYSILLCYIFDFPPSLGVQQNKRVLYVLILQRV